MNRFDDGGRVAWHSRWAAMAAWALAGWPVWRWYVARIGDGSDEPWGVAALGLALVLVPWRRLKEPLPRGAAALAAGAVLTVAVGYDLLPALVRGGLWMFALMALLGGGGAAAARGGLLLLSLPVVATAQFYLGYPLRALTAACCVPVLRLCGYVVERQGTALHWAGETVLVDAPCSGIQMLWTGLFAACALAALRELGGGGTLRLLRWAGAVVAGANLVRCVALFLLAVGDGLPDWLHGAVGLACFGAALAAIAWRAGRMVGAPRGVAEAARAVVGRRVASVARDHGHWATVRADWVFPLLALLFAAVAVRPWFGGRAEGQGTAARFPGWPEKFEGRLLAALELSEREARFAAGFPGQIGVFSDGERTILLRWVARETRQLHPALHCLRGLGYAVEPGPVWRDAAGQNWGTTVARRDGRTRRVRERISDEAGTAWTDVSAWWWDAWRGASAGPWWAATVFEE